MVSSERYQHSIERDVEDGQKIMGNGLGGFLEATPPWPSRADASSECVCDHLTHLENTKGSYNL